MKATSLSASVVVLKAGIAPTDMNDSSVLGKHPSPAF